MTTLRSVAVKWTTRGFRRAVRGVVEEVEIQRRHLRGRREAAALHVANAQIQLGSGRNTKAGWINVDLFAAGADLALDLREEFPFPDASAAFVYSEHLLEHLDYPGDAHRFVREVFRILQPGCPFSVVVPDAALALNAYVDRTSCFFGERRLKGYLVKETPTPMHHVNYTFRADGQHKYAYDEETLGQVLRGAGFVRVARREFDPALDSAKRRGHSLYMQGSKPGGTADLSIGPAFLSAQMV